MSDEVKNPDPNPYAGYGAAMAPTPGFQMAVEYDQTNAAAIRAATTVEALAPFVKSEAAAQALLAKIGSAYDGDPIKMLQIAAVTQLVMSPKPVAGVDLTAARKLWVAALRAVIASADNDYARTFARQQLRLCE